MNYFVLPEKMPAGCSSCELLSNCSDCEGLPCYCQIDKDDKGFPIHKFRDFGAYDPVPDKRPDWCRLRPVGLSSNTEFQTPEAFWGQVAPDLTLKILFLVAPYLTQLPDVKVCEYLRRQAQDALDGVDWQSGVEQFRRRAKTKAKGGTEK